MTTSTPTITFPLLYGAPGQSYSQLAPGPYNTIVNNTYNLNIPSGVQMSWGAAGEYNVFQEYQRDFGRATITVNVTNIKPNTNVLIVRKAFTSGSDWIGQHYVTQLLVNGINTFIVDSKYGIDGVGKEQIGIMVVSPASGNCTCNVLEASIVYSRLPIVVNSILIYNNNEKYIYIDGSNFVSGDTVSFSGPVVPVSSSYTVLVISKTSLQVTMSTEYNIHGVTVKDVDNTIQATYILTTNLISNGSFQTSPTAIFPLLYGAPGQSHLHINPGPYNTVLNNKYYLNIPSGVQMSWAAAGEYNVFQEYQRDFGRATITVNVTNIKPNTNVLIVRKAFTSGSDWIGQHYVTQLLVNGINTFIVDSKYGIDGVGKEQIGIMVVSPASGNCTCNVLEASIVYSPVPIISNICFPAGTPMTTDQGNIPIEKIDTSFHTIRNKQIVAITQTVTQDKYLVCFEKDALGNNIPSQKTIISKNHKLFYNGKMRMACEFLKHFSNVVKVKYTGAILYNVLLEEPNKMMVNNLICETLHPENGVAKVYMALQKLDTEGQQSLIQKINAHVIKNNVFNSNKKMIK